MNRFLKPAFIIIFTSNLSFCLYGQGSTTSITDSTIIISDWNKVKSQIYQRNKICKKIVSVLFKSDRISNTVFTSTSESLSVTNDMIKNSNNFDSVIIKKLFKQYLDLGNHLSNISSILKDTTLVANKKILRLKREYESIDSKLFMLIQNYNDHFDDNSTMIFGIVEPKTLSPI